MPLGCCTLLPRVWAGSVLRVRQFCLPWFVLFPSSLPAPGLCRLLDVSLAPQTLSCPRPSLGGSAVCSGLFKASPQAPACQSCCLRLPRALQSLPFTSLGHFQPPEVAYNSSVLITYFFLHAFCFSSHFALILHSLWICNLSLLLPSLLLQ